MGEATYKTALRKWAKAQDIFYVNVSGGIYSKLGDPDIVFCCNSRFVAIECKAKGGEWTTEQRKRKAQCERSGGVYHVVYSLAEGQQVILSYIKS